MTVYKKDNGTWKPVQHVWRNINGTWTKVRRVFRNVTGAWTQYHGDIDFVAYSLGLLQNQVAGANAGLKINGQATYGAVRSYTLVTFDKYGNVAFERSYDIFGEATGGAPTATPYGSAQFAADVAAIGANTCCLLYTYDEPLAGGHTYGNNAVFQNFINAILALGGTSAVYQSSSFAYRGAYLLLSIKGQTTLFEAYRGTEQSGIGSGGTDSGCLDGAIGISFTITNGSLTGLTRLI
jgi:hypothetical protein